MKAKLFLFIVIIIGFVSCDKGDSPEPIIEEDHEILVVTNITSSNPITAYVGTIKDLNVGQFEVSNARQSTQTPFIVLDGSDVYVIPNKSGDILKKYKKNNGLLEEVASLTLPSSSISISMVIENSERAYLSLWTVGKILVINPTSMEITGEIDLTSYAINDGSPDPANMVMRDGKLYVACVQTSDGYTSAHPAQILIIDIENNNSITSVVDNRSHWAGAIDDMNAVFFDEKGDLYVYCVASYGFYPGQKNGFLRIKNGETRFDPDYFFNVTDFNVESIPNNRIDYFQHVRYHQNGNLYGAGNIYALGSNPPDYVNDRTVGAFKVDLYNQSITKLDLPYCNGYSASVAIYKDYVLWGLSTKSGVGIYSYNHTTGETSNEPIIATQGDPSVIEIFE